MIEIRGAGIAGSYLAYLLAKKGFEVRVYELRKKDLSKPCAGGVLPRVLKIIKLGDVDYVKIKRVDVDFNGKIISHYGELGISVERDELQRYLRELAESEGAEILYSTPHKKFQKDVIKIIASGAGKTRVLGIEVHSSTVKIKPEGYFFKIYRIKYPTRYAWIFPKLSGYSVGLAGDIEWVMRNADLVMKKLGANGRKRGAYIGVYEGRTRFREGDAWHIGDAAKLVDPLNYEGYTGAFHSAFALSQNLRNPDFSSLLKYLNREWNLSKFAGRFPRIARSFIKLWLHKVYSEKL